MVNSQTGKQIGSLSVQLAHLGNLMKVECRQGCEYSRNRSYNRHLIQLPGHLYRPC